MLFFHLYHFIIKELFYFPITLYNCFEKFSKFQTLLENTTPRIKQCPIDHQL